MSEKKVKKEKKKWVREIWGLVSFASGLIFHSDRGV